MNWQLAAGAYTTRQSLAAGHRHDEEAYRQKQGQAARRGNLKTNIMRAAEPPTGRCRDHSHELTKKFRRLGLKTALSAKAADGKLIVLDEAKVETHKTRELAKRLDALGWNNVLIIDAPEVDELFLRAARNLPMVDVLPHEGANLRHSASRSAGYP